MVQIRIENLTKTFDTPSGPEVAVDDVDFTIEHADFFTFVGPSGCGKTTTLRMIAGLETPTKGDIYFDGEKVTDLPPQDRDIAMVFQNITLYPHMTNYENIGYGLRVRGEMEDYDEKIQEVAEVLEISELLDKKPGQLSGGQQQRVSLGRALVRDPNVILFDEPLSDLDAQLKADLRVRIQRIHKEFETTMVYVTHDQEEAMTMSDKIGLMGDGKMQQISDPETLFDYPANEFAAQFIGQPRMNVLEATNDDGVLSIGDNTPFSIDFDEASSSILDGKSTVHVGMRPSHSALSEDLTNALFTATVDVWEPIGGDYIVYLVDSNDTELKAITETAPDHLVGEQVGFGVPERLYLFDSYSGETLSTVTRDQITLKREPHQSADSP